MIYSDAVRARCVYAASSWQVSFPRCVSDGDDTVVPPGDVLCVLRTVLMNTFIVYGSVALLQGP